MDGTAITLCMENKLPVVVFDLFASWEHGAGREGRTPRHHDPERHMSTTEVLGRRDARVTFRQGPHAPPGADAGHSHRPRLLGLGGEYSRRLLRARRRRSTRWRRSRFPSRARSWSSPSTSSVIKELQQGADEVGPRLCSPGRRQGPAPQRCRRSRASSDRSTHPRSRRWAEESRVALRNSRRELNKQADAAPEVPARSLRTKTASSTTDIQEAAQDLREEG